VRQAERQDDDSRHRHARCGQRRFPPRRDGHRDPGDNRYHRGSRPMIMGSVATQMNNDFGLAGDSERGGQHQIPPTRARPSASGHYRHGRFSSSSGIVA
jgi:hypothetical protein